MTGSEWAVLRVPPPAACMHACMCTAAAVLACHACCASAVQGCRDYGAASHLTPTRLLYTPHTLVCIVCTRVTCMPYTLALAAPKGYARTTRPPGPSPKTLRTFSLRSSNPWRVHRLPVPCQWRARQWREALAVRHSAGLRGCTRRCTHPRGSQLATSRMEGSRWHGVPSRPQATTYWPTTYVVAPVAAASGRRGCHQTEWPVALPATGPV